MMYTVLAVVLFMLMRIYTKGNVANLFREPVSLALLGLLVIHALLPLVQYPLNFYRYQAGYSLLAHTYSIILALIFAIVMSGAYSMFGTTSRQSQLPVLLPMSQMGKIYLLFGVTLPALIAAFLYYRTILGFGFEAWARDRVWFSNQIGMPALISRWLYIAFIVSVAGYFTSSRRSKQILLLLCVLGVIIVVFFAFIQSRNSILLAFIAAMGVYFVTSPKSRIILRSLMFSKAGIIICLLFVTMVVVRQMRPMTKKMARDSLPTIVMKVTNGAFGNHENVLWMTDNEFDIQLGKTYLAGLVNIYPRAYWPTKPLGAGPFMKNLVNPGSYVPGKRGMSSLTTGMVTESYMNGGMIGVVLIAALTGIVLRFLTIFRNRCYGPWSVSMYCYSVLTLAFAMTYGEFLGMYTRWLTDMFPLVIGFIVCEALSRSPARNMAINYG